MGLSSKISPFLWFPTPLALTAAEFYVSLFNASPNPHRAKSTITGQSVSTKDTAQDEQHPSPGSILTVNFSLCGQDFIALNGPHMPDKPHNTLFPFNESISFSIDCESQEEIDYFWDGLTKNGGKVIECGWCKDQFGVRWQVVPRRLMELLNPEGEGGEAGGQVKVKVTAAMLKMKKLDIQGLEDAAKEARDMAK